MSRNRGPELIGAILRRLMVESEPSPEAYREMDYSEYLMTDHWRDTRKRAVLAAGMRCARCQSKYRLEVHHLTYERLGEERPGDLMVLCRRCHKLVHSEEHRKVS